MPLHTNKARLPLWLCAYAEYLFFGRSILHKVQGRLLPPRVIKQGVDMGRAFSVFVFCVAIMDPVYWHLHQLCRLTGVEGHVDDCTAAGVVDSEFAWLREVRSVYAAVHSAGFQVLDHDCFWGFALSTRLSPENAGTVNPAALLSIPSLQRGHSLRVQQICHSSMAAPIDGA